MRLTANLISVVERTKLQIRSIVCAFGENNEMGQRRDAELSLFDVERSLYGDGGCEVVQPQSGPCPFIFLSFFGMGFLL
jgi:hypothetical protein